MVDDFASDNIHQVKRLAAASQPPVDPDRNRVAVVVATYRRTNEFARLFKCLQQCESIVVVPVYDHARLSLA